MQNYMLNGQQMIDICVKNYVGKTLVPTTSTYMMYIEPITILPSQLCETRISKLPYEYPNKHKKKLLY